HFPRYLSPRKPIFYIFSKPFPQLRHLYSLVIIYRSQKIRKQIFHMSQAYRCKMPWRLMSRFVLGLPWLQQFLDDSVLGSRLSKPKENHNTFFLQRPKHTHLHPYLIQQEADDNCEHHTYFLNLSLVAMLIGLKQPF